jgi:hypothetical protein
MTSNYEGFFLFTAISGGLVLHLMHHQQIKEGRPKSEEEVVKLLTIRLDSDVQLIDIPKNPSTICAYHICLFLTCLGSSYRFRVGALTSVWALQLIMTLAIVYFNWNPATIQGIHFPFM